MRTEIFTALLTRTLLNVAGYGKVFRHTLSMPFIASGIVYTLSYAMKLQKVTSQKTWRVRQILIPRISLASRGELSKKPGENLLLCLLGRLAKLYSSMLQTIVLNSPLVNESESELPIVGLKPEDLERLARLAFTQLTELRHRGAFSAVAHTYAACCLRCHQSGRIDILEGLYNVSQLLRYLTVKNAY